MDKINWINGQAGGTPLSAENLNQMQDNIEDAINALKEEMEGNILYENSTGTSGDVTLSQSIADMKRIRISGYNRYNNNETYFSQDFDVDFNVSKGLLMKSYAGTINSFFAVENLIFLTSSIVRGPQYIIVLPNVDKQETAIFITKVVGFNY